MGPDVRELRARRERLSELVPALRTRVAAADARVLAVRDAADRAEAGVKDAPDHVPEDLWETLTDAVGKGFSAALAFWAIWPIVLVLALGYFVVHGIATCGEAHGMVVRWTGSVLESSRPDVRLAAACVVDASGNLDTKRCRATVMCDGRRLFDGDIGCIDEERVTGTDSDGDPTTSSMLMLSGPTADVDGWYGRGNAGGVRFVLHTRDLDRSGP